MWNASISEVCFPTENTSQADVYGGWKAQSVCKQRVLACINYCGFHHKLAPVAANSKLKNRNLNFTWNWNTPRAHGWGLFRGKSDIQNLFAVPQKPFIIWNDIFIQSYISILWVQEIAFEERIYCNSMQHVVLPQSIPTFFSRLYTFLLFYPKLLKPSFWVYTRYWNSTPSRCFVIADTWSIADQKLK